MQRTKKEKKPIGGLQWEKINAYLESKGDIIRRAVEAEKEHGILTFTNGGLTSTIRHEPLQPSPV